MSKAQTCSLGREFNLSFQIVTEVHTILVLSIQLKYSLNNCVQCSFRVIFVSKREVDYIMTTPSKAIAQSERSGLKNSLEPLTVTGL